MLFERMVKELKRPGRAGGGGLYHYPLGAPKQVWPELRTRFEKPAITPPSIDALKQRLLCRQAIETACCLTEG